MLQKRNLRILCALISFAWIASWAPAKAQTLNEIKQRGRVIIGVQAENPPWGFVEANGNLAGYEIDVSNLMGRELGVPVEFVRVTSPNRIAQLQTGKVDVLVAVVGMYPDRAKVIQFSKPYGTLQNLVIAPKSTNIKTFADLSGKRVGVARGTAQDKVLTENAPKDATLQRFDDDATATQSLLSGQVDVIGGNNTYIPNMTKVSPGHPFENKFILQTQWQGVGMRQGDKELLRWTNNFVDKIIKSGELNAISKKWLAQDLPEFPTEVPGVPFNAD